MNYHNKNLEMKGKLKESFPTSENEAIADGTEVEIVNGWCSCDGYYFQCELPGGRQIVINSNNIEITDHRPYIDWEERRFELIKAAMQGNLPTSVFDKETFCKYCISIADEMITQLNS